MRSCGTRSFQAASDSRTCTSSSPKRRSTARGASWSPSRSAWTSTRTRPEGAWLELDPPADRRAVDLAALGEDHLRARRRSRGRRTGTGCPRRRTRASTGGRQRLGRLRVAEREVVVLDGEDVREVGAEAERELERDRLHGVVLHAEVILHSHADEALARDREHVRRQLRARVAQVERGREVLDPVGREQERPLAVDRELEDARGSGRPWRRTRSSASRSLRWGHRRRMSIPRGSSATRYASCVDVERRIRPPLDCASAFTTSSSTFTWAGRVSAKTMHSAMSSGSIASTPS